MPGVETVCQSIGNNIREHYQCIATGASQKIAVTGTAALSAAITTGIVRLFSTKDCWIVFGNNPVAVANDGDSFFLPGGIIEYYVINHGQKLSVIQDVAAGDLHITGGDVKIL